MARARQAQDAATARQQAEPASEEEEPPAGTQADGEPAAIEALRADHDRLQAEVNTLREENGRLRSSNQELRAESGRRDAETRKLNDLIARSRRTEEQWRQAYVESRKGRRSDDVPVSIDSVGEAVALAREAFPDRLLIKLNSRSNENTPFTNPAEVYDALAWLATAHCDANDKRIGEACSGWTYKANQREESIAKYREWYETLADGKTWYLGAHIGKGASRDPRHTIRIGFVRDEEDNRVIVGFIGLHQRNGSHEKGRPEQHAAARHRHLLRARCPWDGPSRGARPLLGQRSSPEAAVLSQILAGSGARTGTGIASRNSTTARSAVPAANSASHPVIVSGRCPPRPPAPTWGSAQLLLVGYRCAAPATIMRSCRSRTGVGGTSTPHTRVEEA